MKDRIILNSFKDRKLEMLELNLVYLIEVYDCVENAKQNRGFIILNVYKNMITESIKLYSETQFNEFVVKYVCTYE